MDYVQLNCPLGMKEDSHASSSSSVTGDTLESASLGNVYTKITSESGTPLKNIKSGASVALPFIQQK